MTRVKLNHQGIEDILKTNPLIRQMVSQTAEQVANDLREDSDVQRLGAEVVAEDYVTDRASSAVVLKHPVALGIQAKHGSITKAAAANGLTVKDPKQGRRG